MSLEDLLQEHIKALNENTKALVAHTKALRSDNPIDVEHTKDSACKFCGITYKTLQSCIDNGLITPSRKLKGTREYFKENDLAALCEAKRFYGGEYGDMKSNPKSAYFAG